jgi:hypothetical protein
MLVLKTTQERNQEGTEAYIEFLEATGTYDASTNPGGFGTPNPDRSSFAAVMVAIHRLVNGDVPANILAYDPVSVTSFTIEITPEVNGHLKYDLFLIPFFDEMLTYQEGDITYDNRVPADPSIIIYQNAQWVSIPKEDLIDSGSDLTQKNGNALIIPVVEEFQNTLDAERLKKLREFIKQVCECEEYDKARLNFDFVDAMLGAALRAFCSGAYAEAQIDIEEILSFKAQLDG